MTIIGIIIVAITAIIIFALLNRCSGGLGIERDNSLTLGNTSEVEFTGITNGDFNVNKADLTQKNNRDTFHEIFSDERGIEFGFDRRTGNLSSISGVEASLGREIPDIALLSVKEAEYMADDIASNLIDISLYDRVSHMGVSLTQRFNYTRIVNGFLTEEGGSVWICYSGVVLLVSFFDVGLFDEITVPPINETALDAAFEDEMRREFGHRGIINFEIDERMLIVRNNRLYMSYAFVYQTEDMYPEFYSELEFINIRIPN